MPIANLFWCTLAKYKQGMNPPSPLPVYLTIDIGPALATLGYGHSRKPDWAPTMAGLTLLREAVPALEDRLGVHFPITWFVRGDKFIKRQFGTRLAIIEKFMFVMGASISKDHEIGWMPQLPFEGEDTIDYDDLHFTHEEIAGFLPGFRSVRMGDCYHDNESMHTIAELGVQFDCSAVPGRMKSDPGWHVDWSITPSTPYHPSCVDYRIPGHPYWDVLEIPMSVVPMKAHYDRNPLLRYINPCFFDYLLWPEMTKLLSSANYLICVLHPDELISDMPNRHPMIAYSPEVFANNLSRIINEARQCGRIVSFHCLREFNNVAAKLRFP